MYDGNTISGLSLPAEFSTVRCGRDPYNLRPPLNAVMGATNWLLERMPRGQKLVILAGEQHDNDVETILQIAILEAQLKTGLKIGLGYEFPHNTAPAADVSDTSAIYKSLESDGEKCDYLLANYARKREFHAPLMTPQILKQKQRKCILLIREILLLAGL